jgi:NAD(P)-dependent dehydrogenase (short-subunit alcohol dehydrogenase family)
MIFRFDGKNAVVTGGASGIGKAASLALARQGAFVHILELNADAATGVLNEIEEGGGKGIVLTCDVTNHQQVQNTCAAIGKIDVLVNNAGIAHVGKAHTTTEEDLDRVYAVNVKGVYNCLHAVLPMMQAVGGGVILNLCSIAAHVGLPDRFAYSMSKGAIFAITLSVAKDYIGDGIRCNSISPARVHTPFVDGFIARNYPGQESEMFDKLSKTQPIGRMGTPGEIANLIVYLCSDEASFITGCDYPIDGGFITLNN